MVIEEKDIPYFQAYLLELKKAYFSGASRVKYRDRDTTFRSTAEMEKLIDDLEKSLNPVEVVRSGAAFAEFNSGY